MVISYFYLVLTATPISVIQPSPGSMLRSLAILRCEIAANFSLDLNTVESRWILPNGSDVKVNDNNDDKYLVTQGVTSTYETILLIRNLTYSDANTYTCEIRDIRDPNNRGEWLPFEVTLQLLGKHKALNLINTMSS